MNTIKLDTLNDRYYAVMVLKKTLIATRGDYKGSKVFYSDEEKKLMYQPPKSGLPTTYYLDLSDPYYEGYGWEVYDQGIHDPKKSPEERYKEIVLNRDNIESVTIKGNPEANYSIKNLKFLDNLFFIDNALRLEAIEGSGFTVDVLYKNQKEEVSNEKYKTGIQDCVCKNSP